MILVLGIAITGTINSLADFLFESEYVSDAVKTELLATTGWLRQLRVVHPAVAIVGGIVLLLIVNYLNQGVGADAKRLGYVVQGTVGLLFVVGVANIALRTPLETQLVHLLLADVLWISFLLYVLRLGSEPEAASPRAVERAHAA